MVSAPFVSGRSVRAAGAGTRVGSTGRSARPRCVWMRRRWAPSGPCSKRGSTNATLPARQGDHRDAVPIVVELWQGWGHRPIRSC